VGAVKYADLLPNRQSDYVFSWDKMLACKAIPHPICFTRMHGSKYIPESGGTGIGPPEFRAGPDCPEEIVLAKQLLNFGLTLEAVAEEYRPNFLVQLLV